MMVHTYLPGRRRMREEDGEMGASLGYLRRLYQKKKVK